MKCSGNEKYLQQKYEGSTKFLNQWEKQKTNWAWNSKLGKNAAERQSKNDKKKKEIEKNSLLEETKRRKESERGKRDEGEVSTRSVTSEHRQLKVERAFSLTDLCVGFGVWDFYQRETRR